MKQLVNKKVRLTLVGYDGNSFLLMGAFRRHAKRDGWTEEEIRKVLDECMSGSYENLVATLTAHCEDEVEEE